MTHLLGATEGTGPVQGVWGGYGGGICGGTPDDLAWESGRDAKDLETLVHGGRAAEISNRLSDQGRTADLPGGGMPGPSGNEDVNAGPFPIQAFPVHRGHSGGEKPPPPTMHLMRHAGPPAGTEQQLPCHSSVRQGNGAKESAASGGGDEGYLREGLRGISGAARKCDDFVH